MAVSGKSTARFQALAVFTSRQTNVIIWRLVEGIFGGEGRRRRTRRHLVLGHPADRFSEEHVVGHVGVRTRDPGRLTGNAP